MLKKTDKKKLCDYCSSKTGFSRRNEKFKFKKHLRAKNPVQFNGDKLFTNTSEENFALYKNSFFHKKWLKYQVASLPYKRLMRQKMQNQNRNKHNFSSDSDQKLFHV